MNDVLSAYTAGIAAVDPAALVKLRVRAGGLPEGPLQVLALGKAAPQMVWGLIEAGVAVRGLGVAPRGQKVPQTEGFRWLAGDHPVPGPASFHAGSEVLAWADRQEQDVLVLLSGGASACVEVPAPGCGQDDVVRLHKELLHAPLGIEEVNRRRGAVSALKSGRLGIRMLERGAQVRCWVLQDTQDPRSVGSGPLATPGIDHDVLGDNGTMVAAAGLRLATLGYEVYRHEHGIWGPLEDALDGFLDAFGSISGPRPALVGGGEPRIAVPLEAPRGGRNQHAALAAAERLPDGVVFAALASDGIDGTTAEAGAWVRKEDAAPEARKRYDAHRHLESRDRTLRAGPTGTNVADLWIAFKQ